MTDLLEKLDKVKTVKEIFQILGDGFQALMGRKPIASKVAVLSNPENPKSMSILTKGQTRFVANAYYCASVPEWGGLFDGLRDYADEVMEVSPSNEGIGRTQVISFVGAMGGEAVLKKLGISLKEGEVKEEKD